MSCWSLGFSTSWMPALVPPAWYSHSSPAPSERREVKCLRATMYSPSGVQVGLLSRRKLSSVTWRASLPSAAMVQMLLPPLRSEVKAMRLPSGDQRGWISQARPLLMRVAAPPETGMRYRSPSSENTIVRPSGDTSTSIQVPSLVSKRTVLAWPWVDSTLHLPLSSAASASARTPRALSSGASAESTPAASSASCSSSTLSPSSCCSCCSAGCGGAGGSWAMAESGASAQASARARTLRVIRASGKVNPHNIPAARPRGPRRKSPVFGRSAPCALLPS